MLTALALLVAALFAGIAVMLSPLEPGVLALQFAWTPRAFARVVHAWPPEHLALFRAHLGIDGVLLVGYAALGVLLVTRSGLFAGLRPVVRRVLAALLPLAAAFDAIENGLHWWLTGAPRFGVAPLYAVAALCATLKWLLLIGFVLAAAWALVAARRARMRAAQRSGDANI